jgi:superfamily I DNA/RNA helicase
MEKFGLKDQLKFKDIALILKIYSNLMKEFNYMDFVDLELHTRYLLQRHPEAAKFKALFVYEGEDMDKIAADIICSILKQANSAVISNNPDISIFHFRGAMPSYFADRLSNEFKCKKVDLKKDHENINEVPSRKIEADTRDEQANAVAKHIALKIRSGINPKDIVIISRSVGDDLHVFNEALRKRGINYILVGGIGFFRQPEIIEFMSLLNCIHKSTSADENHICRTIKIMEILKEEQIDVLRRTILIDRKSFLDAFREMFPVESADFWKIIETSKAKSKEMKISAFIYYLMNEFGFIKKSIGDEFVSGLYSYFYRILTDYADQFKKLRKAELNFENLMDNLYELLSGFGKEMDIPYSSELEAVKIMTIQQSKGSIFKHVYMVDMTEDNFPRPFFENPLLTSYELKQLGIEPVNDIDAQYLSEKRLFDIAQTRASEETVYCSYNTNNDNSPTYVSPFIRELELDSVYNEITNAILDETDLFVKLVGDNYNTSAEGFDGLFNDDLTEKLKRIQFIISHNENSVMDTVTEGIPKIFSASALETFKDCPEKYFLKQIVKLKEPVSPHAFLGKAVHKILQLFHGTHDENSGSDDYGNGDINKIVNKVWIEMDFYSRFEKRNLYLITKRMVDNYLKYISGKIPDVTGVEEDFEFKFCGIKLRGRIDRIDKLEYGCENVVDYKTGKNSKMEKGLLSEIKNGKNFQIPVYRWARDAACISIYWLRKEKGKMEAAIDFTKPENIEVLNAAEQNLIDTVETIRSGIFHAEGENCRMCYFSPICRN